MNNNELERERTSCFFIGIILLIPILRYYDIIGSLGLESVLRTIAALLVFYLFHFESIYHQEAFVKSRNWFLLFCIWSVAITLAYELGSDINISSSFVNYTLFSYVLAIVSMIIIYGTLSGKVDLSKTFIIYEKIVYFLVAIYLVQIVMNSVGIRISFKVPGLKYGSAYGYLNSEIMGFNGARPSSLFSERAHFAEYITPFIAVCLFSDKIIKRHRLVKAIFFSVVTISTVSGNGIIILLIEWGLYFIFFSNLKGGVKIPVIILAAIVFAFAYNQLQSNEAYSDIFNRMFANNTGNEYLHAKADYRIYRGFDLFIKLPMFQKIIGVGYEHMYIFARLNQIESIYDSSSQAYEFFNTIAQILLYFGIIGFILFCGHMLMLFFSRSKVAKGLVIISIALWLSSQMLYSNTHIMYLLLTASAVSLINSEERKSEQVRQKHLYIRND